MGRLIDADVLMEYFKRLSDECSSENNYEYSNLYDCVCAEIMTQPTAYDVEKVVAELIQFGLNSMDKQTYDSETYYDGVSVAIRKACNIVKRGGIDERT